MAYSNSKIIKLLFQVLGLWMVVVDHEVEQVLKALSNNNNNFLRQLVLR